MYIRNSERLGFFPGIPAFPGVDIDFKKAVRLNRHYRKKLGWEKDYQQILKLLGYTTTEPPGEESFAQAVAFWQRNQGLKGKAVDGIIGPNTWQRMKTAIKPATPTGSGGTKYKVSHPYWPENIVKPAIVDIDKAVSSNRRYAKELGWRKNRHEIEQLLIKALKWPAITSEKALAMAVAQWQMRQSLTVDGVIGPNTWRRIQVLMCRAYERGETEKSYTQQGHLKQDVSIYKGRLLIADFGVNRSGVKSSTKREKTLKEWLNKFETDPAYELLIMGFSDCVGAEKNNEALRRARAAEVHKLLGKGARSRVAFVGSARMDRTVTSNLTVQGRAMNRSVVIEFKRDIDYEGETVTVKPPTLKEIVDNCRRVLDKQKTLGFNLSSEQIKRIRCYLQKILDPTVDDRYVPISKWEGHGAYLWKKVSTKFFEDTFISRLRSQVRALHPSEREKYILGLLEHWDEQIYKGIYKGGRLELPAGGGSSVSPGNKQIHDWIAKQQRDSKSIYSCYR